MAWHEDSALLGVSDAGKRPVEAPRINSTYEYIVERPSTVVASNPDFPDGIASMVH